MADDTSQQGEHVEEQRREVERRTSARRSNIKKDYERPTDPTQLHPFDPEYERPTTKPKHGVWSLLDRARAPGKSQEVWLTEEEMPKYRMPEAKPRAPGAKPDENDPVEKNVWNAMEMLGVDNFMVAIRTRCVRNAFMTGLGMGFGMTALRLIMRKSKGAATWGVLTSAGTSSLVFPYCLYKNRLEKSHMQRAVDISQQKKIAAEKKREEDRAARRKAKEEEDQRREEAKRKSTWKFW
ncbi:hypothetical protein P152DRAFT_475520 [Eremomyces bilateralis CBS 781.70]|uniref:Cytochrome c oxidase assembly protein COX20, mitochondrial n=1 Tax=Eremomyces bilateralis CBS 781.70 TaxID=1392243 RepID=A0A6G1FY59_9PEZI|nr:uncharacterized protein P152DRAFT_475520 [Eremomyces bilateralis CBS 781.70]KAF1810698.1 hypothetical protein P152DRAFT_475520 [Eremomyces bilateralis CBS 781.70]